MDKVGSKKRARLIAFYLPQFHPIPENDIWWGKGFTEWTNVAKAKPLYRGHYQPHVPADLGFYDLRLPEARGAQAELAEKYGVEGFCYYHYWFAGKQLLERPFNEVLSTGEPRLPFCLCWANQTWSGIWHGAPHRILIEQTYPGESDYVNHFNYLIKAFTDPRYMTVDGRPIFLIFRPMQIPEVKRATDTFRELASRAGLSGLHLVGVERPGWKPTDHGFDASITPRLPSRWISWRAPLKKLTELYGRWAGWPEILTYENEWAEMVQAKLPGIENYPCVLPNWDNTPRSGKRGFVLQGSTPELFKKQLSLALKINEGAPEQHNIVFLKSWNEWAEGNYVEPDLRFGLRYLEAIRSEILVK